MSLSSSLGEVKVEQQGGGLESSLLYQQQLQQQQQLQYTEQQQYYNQWCGDYSNQINYYQVYNSSCSSLYISLDNSGSNS